MKHADLPLRALVLFLTAAIAMTGCESTGAIKTPDEVESASHISYGRVHVLTSEKPESWIDDCGVMKYMICPDAFRVIVIPADGGEPVTHRLKDDGTFFWALPPGNYTIAEYEWEVWGRDRGVRHGTVDGQFTIPANPGATYLGTLTLDLYDGSYNLWVEDDYDEATQRLKAKLGQSFKSAQRSLITIDKGPVGSLDKDPDDEVGSAICTGEWGIVCTSHYSGVTPTSPVADVGQGFFSGMNPSFRKVPNLTPQLQWGGSSDPEVTYDIIVRKAIAYSKMGSSRYIDGPVVAYARGLAEPRYRFTIPLEPSEKYFWTVRLRRGDLVSNWSKMQGPNYQGFAFSFQTPQ